MNEDKTFEHLVAQQLIDLVSEWMQVPTREILTIDPASREDWLRGARRLIAGLHLVSQAEISLDGETTRWRHVTPWKEVRSR